MNVMIPSTSVPSTSASRTTVSGHGRRRTATTAPSALGTRGTSGSGTDRIANASAQAAIADQANTTRQSARTTAMPAATVDTAMPADVAPMSSVIAIWRRAIGTVSPT